MAKRVRANVGRRSVGPPGSARARADNPSTPSGYTMPAPAPRARGTTTDRESSASRKHWEGIYSTRGEDELSWHQDVPRLSQQLVERYAQPNSRIVDAGGGSSTLAARLNKDGFHRVTVVDISGSALRRAQARAGKERRAVRYLQADLLRRRSLGRVDLWHDRAVFHFLTRVRDRRAYLGLLRRSLVPGGVAIIASFALDGPETCSGLPVARYSPKQVAQVFGERFRIEESRREVHRTPWGTTQPFVYSVLRFTPTKRGRST